MTSESTPSPRPSDVSSLPAVRIGAPPSTHASQGEIPNENILIIAEEIFQEFSKNKSKQFDRLTATEKSNWCDAAIVAINIITQNVDRVLRSREKEYDVVVGGGGFTSVETKTLVELG